MCLEVFSDYISQAGAEDDNAPRIAFEWSQGSGESLSDLFEEVLQQLAHDHDSIVMSCMCVPSAVVLLKAKRRMYAPIAGLTKS